jgi:D-alanyl-lipoteichoic acid acyltransferase DltB (MBOAT superfamily)
MPFLSFPFALFLGLGLLAFYLSRPANRPVVLLVLCFAFYLTWSFVHAALLGAVTATVYATGLWIERQKTERRKQALCAAGVASLVVLLFAFKSANWLLNRFGSASVAAVAIPLGLSYYVFKMVGYLLDVYWEALPAQRNFTTFALYGAFFPQIVSGPIQRAESFFDQMERLKEPDPDQFIIGLRRILFGLFKKVVIADNLGALVATVFANPAEFSRLELLLGAYCFAIQLYADLSGLTDIAIGVGLLFGMRGPENFDMPFLAPNIQVFWRRWHMSLTTWLVDYLFTPLRMSLRNLGTAGLCLAIFINMAAIGLWHGLGPKFLVFGLVHGMFVTLSVLTLKRRNLVLQKWPMVIPVRAVAAPLLTFHMVVLSLVIFRAETLKAAEQYLELLLPGQHFTGIPAMRLDLGLLGTSPTALILCFLAFFTSEAVIWAAKHPFSGKLLQGVPAFWQTALYCAVAAVVLFLFKGNVEFIYARF